MEPKGYSDWIREGKERGYHDYWKEMTTIALTPQATDKGCCEKCSNPSPFGIVRGGFRRCLKEDCPCHQAPTPSLSEGEEKQIANIVEKHWWQNGLFETVTECKKSHKDAIVALLSQTLSNERQRMVKLGEELKGMEPVGDPDMVLNIKRRTYNKAIEAYQQKIKSLNS